MDSLKPEKILIRSLNWLGDAVMSLPAICRLREARPDAHITVLAPEKLADLWRPPLIDSVMTFSKEESIWQVSRRLRAERFDLAVILPFSFHAAMEACLAGIPRRIGYRHKGRAFPLTRALPKIPGIAEIHKRSPAEVRQIIQSGLTPPRPPVPPASHHIHRYLNLVAALGADPTPVMPCLFLDEAELSAAARKFGLELEPTAPPLFGMNPGAEYGHAKRWPEERFIAAAVELQAQVGCRWVLFGGPADAEMTGRIAAAIQKEADRRRGPGALPEKVAWNLGGATTLRELCAVLKLCRLLVTNDTGPMHVAAAVGTPVVVPFGSTSPGMTGPGVPGQACNQLLLSDAPCSPCYLRECPIDFRCMNSISVQRVTQAVREIIAS